MRLLVAGRRAEVVARAAGAFARDLTIETAATKVAAIDLLERAQFDLVLACETLGDGSGLEVLSHVVVTAPDTLRIFAARPSTLDLLKGELGLFDLLCTLPYPIKFRRLWSTINLVRSYRASVDAPPGPRPPTRIPESDAFKRARARRNEAKRRGDLSVAGESLAQLAQQLVTTPGPTLDTRAARGGWKRAAGRFAAGTAAFLAVFMLHSHRSIGPPALPRVASSDRPVSEKALPWLPQLPQTPQLPQMPRQTPVQQPTPATFVPGATAAPATTDSEEDAQAEAEAQFEQSGNRTNPPGLSR